MCSHFVLKQIALRTNGVMTRCWGRDLISMLWFSFSWACGCLCFGFKGKRMISECMFGLAFLYSNMGWCIWKGLVRYLNWRWRYSDRGLIYFDRVEFCVRYPNMVRGFQIPWSIFMCNIQIRGLGIQIWCHFGLGIFEYALLYSDMALFGFGTSGYGALHLYMVELWWYIQIWLGVLVAIRIFL